MEKFPEHIDAPSANGGKLATGSYTNGSVHDRWPSPIRTENSGYGYPNGQQFSQPSNGYTRSHGRQKSLSDAIRTIRTRNGSFSQNAHEIADALKAPISPKLVILCLLWYTSSALTNTSSKSILNAFKMPATLTLVQFAFVSSLCILMAWLATVFPILREKITALRHPIRAPSRDVLATTLPLAAFQIVGHLLSSSATSRIPVSLVHTIKGLSPLFTVLAYRVLYNIRYPQATYISLIPLTLGVMLACSGKSGFGGQMLGVIQALVATLIFVTQNIFSKKLFNEAAKAEAEGGSRQSKKLDKLNLLCYSSGLAFVLTLPIWFWSEGITLLGDFLADGAVELSEKPGSFDHGRLTLEFVFNGIFHFGQNILAFVLLSMVSPVTYSVASLLKRVFVIVMAIFWFRNPTTPLQGVGIALTFLGLYLYDRSSERNKADRRVNAMANGRATPLLPLSENPNSRPGSSYANQTTHPYNAGYYPANPLDTKKHDGFTQLRV